MEEFLRTVAPYTTPLNIVLLAGLGWLARDRAKVITALDAAQKALIDEKEKRAEMLERNYQEFLERGEVLSKTLNDFTNRANEILRRVR